MPSKKRKILLIIVEILLLLLMFAAYQYYSKVLATQMNYTQQQEAEKVLAQGISINDPAQDFPLMGQKGENVKEKPNNDNPYNLPFLDIKEVRAAKDSEYLYFQIIFFDKIPRHLVKLSGDKIISDGIKVNIVNDKGVEQLDLGIAYGYRFLNDANCFYSTEPTGIEWPENARFAKENRDCKVFVGADYVIGALPTKDNALLREPTIYFNVQHEAESRKFDHAAVDLLGGKGKMPAVIKWTPETNEFEIYNDFYPG